MLSMTCLKGGQEKRNNKEAFSLFARTYGSTTIGVNGVLIDVEVDVSRGLPRFDIVGLPDAAVKEARERVRTAIKNSGIKLPPGKITINLAPADIKKDSSGLDLPMAVGLLIAEGILPEAACQNCLFAAELSLEGELRGIQGLLPMAVNALKQGIKKLFVASENVSEALLVKDLPVYTTHNLAQLVDLLTGKEKLTEASGSSATAEQNFVSAEDFADVQGQFLAKRALEIAAAGGHNVLMIGVPGSGKTMLARRMSSILPPLTEAEALEVTKIYSVAGMLPQNAGLIKRRPFRSPHHTITVPGMIGGGTIPKPGEVTLSHNGVLFLDELPEFNKAALEVLRQPLEDGVICIARVHAAISFPASFMLISSMNPCPCGFSGDEFHSCTCTVNEIRRYTKKISGPLLDRIDIHIRVPRVEYKDMLNPAPAESSSAIRTRVEHARLIQTERLQKYKIFCNAQMSHAMIKKFCPMTEAAQLLLEQVFEKMRLSARSYDRIIKVARTIADLDHAQILADRHIAEAIQLRNDMALGS